MIDVGQFRYQYFFISKDFGFKPQAMPKKYRMFLGFLYSKICV